VVVVVVVVGKGGGQGRGGEEAAGGEEAGGSGEGWWSGWSCVVGRRQLQWKCWAMRDVGEGRLHSVSSLSVQQLWLRVAETAGLVLKEGSRQHMRLSAGRME